MTRRREFFVSGIVQISVFADTAEEAVRVAVDRADRRSTPTVILSLDNIADKDQAAVALSDAALLDGAE